MDGDERRGTQYGTPYQSSRSARPAPGQPMGPPSSERYSQQTRTPPRSEVVRSSMTGSYLPSYGGYGFSEQQYTAPHMHSGSSMQGVDMQYGSSYGPGTSRRQTPQSDAHQQYTPYGQGTMLPPVASSMYDTLPQFQQRQTAVEVMASQFSMPHYMPQGEQSSGGVSAASSQYLSSQPEQTGYASLAVTRGPLQQSFAPSTADYSLMEQQEVQEPQEAGVQDALNAEMQQYEQQLKVTFEAIVAGRVTEASEKLLALSRWLLGSVVALGRSQN